jgi:hypothetical protein
MCTTEKEGLAFQPDFMHFLLDLNDHEVKLIVFRKCVGIRPLLVPRAIYELDGLCALTVVSSYDKTTMLPFIIVHEQLIQRRSNAGNPLFESRENICW